MTFNSFPIRIICLVVMLSVLWTSPCSAGTDGTQLLSGASVKADQSVVLLYGSFDDPPNGRKELMALYSLLRSYSSKVSLVQVDDYRSGMLKGAHYVFAAGMRKENVRDDLGRDLQSFTGVIGWIGGGIERYAGYGITPGFTVEGYTDQLAEIRYPFQGGESGAEPILTGQTKFAPKLAITDGQMAQSLGTVSDGLNSFPFVIHSNNIWCISMFGSDGPNGILFRDVLTCLFGKTPSPAPHAYIKLDNISPLNNQVEMKKAAQWLQQEGVAFMFELRPVFINTDFKEMESYLQTVRSLVEMGGTPVLGNLQGWSPPDEWQTYVEGYSPVSGEASSNPANLIDKSLRAYIQNNIYPVALSGPPDLMFDPEFSDVVSRFSIFVQKGPWKSYSRDIQPDAAWEGLYILDFMPNENKEDIRRSQPLSQPYPELAKAERPVVFSYDSTAQQDALQAAVLHLKQTGTMFDDLMKTDSAVAFGDTSIQVKDGILTVNGKRPVYLEKPLLGESVDSPDKLTGVNKRIKQTMVVVFGISGTFVVLFLLAFLTGKRIDRRKHMR